MDFVASCVSPLYYENDVRQSLLRYKFHGATGYARVYAPLVADCIRTQLDKEFDLITWVPLSRKRLRRRGYDQARLLAEAVAEALGTDAVGTLKKLRHTAAQSQTGSAEKRRANISGAYRVPDPAQVADKRRYRHHRLYVIGMRQDAGARRSGAGRVRNGRPPPGLTKRESVNYDYEHPAAAGCYGSFAL